MTIGIDGSRAFISGRTGTENYSYQVIKGLAEIEKEEKKKLHPNDIERRYLIYINKSQIAKFKSQNFPSNFQYKVINLPRLWTQVGLSVRTFLDPIDILFIPSHTLPLIRKPGLRTILTVHDLGAEYLPTLHQLKQILYLRFMTHYQLKTASRLIAVSEATRHDLVKRVKINPDNIEVIYEGVDDDVFTKIPNDILSDILNVYKLSKNKYFLFVGTIQPRKNLERLIRAFDIFLKSTSGKQGQGYKLVLVGGKGWQSEEIYSLPKDLGIEDSVIFTGRVTEEDLVGLYNGATALSYVSLFEGFGLPILEAFACSCPVLTSNISSMPEIAGKAALVVDPYNTEAISENLKRLASNDRLRDLLIKKGILRYKHFSWKTTAENILRVLMEK